MSDIHMIKETSKGSATTKCGSTVKTEFSTIWNSEVSCQQCLEKMREIVGMNIHSEIEW